MEAEVRAVPKASLGKRFLASLIDGVAVFIVSIIPVIGALIGIAYMLTRDSIVFMLTKDESFRNRSLGKKLIGIRVVRLSGDDDVDIMTSVKRNFTLVIGAVVAFIISSMTAGVTLGLGGLLDQGMVDPVAVGMTAVAGLAILVLVWLISVIPGAIECLLVLMDGKGRRLGDRFAGTQVVED